MAENSPAIELQQFRVEAGASGVVHLVFDMPGRPMNVFSNAAIAELTVFSRWLRNSDAAGVVIRSGKSSAFCAGADLGELGVAYDMIMAAPESERGRVAFDHFFPLSQALRAIETSGKPVAAAIAGLALGGGGELALAAHYRVMTDDGKAAFGLPESLVGLLPGAGGTQRLPRLIGVAKALPVLLDGARLTGQAALSTGVIDELIPPGQEVAAAERWVVAQVAANVRQPWDRAGWMPDDLARMPTIVAERRARVLDDTFGHYPAPLAILDCVEQGLPQHFDEAIRTEMQIFSRLIQRREPRNMIQSQFLGRLDHDRLKKAGDIPESITGAVKAVVLALASDDADVELAAAFARAGFRIPSHDAQPSGDVAPQTTFWLEDEPQTEGKRALRERLSRVYAAADAHGAALSDAECRAADFILTRDHGFPAYLGGAFSSVRAAL